MALTSQRGREMIVDEYNFIYVLDNTQTKMGAKKYWSCERNKTCNGRAHSVDGVIIRRTDVHTRAADKARTSAEQTAMDIVVEVST